MKNTLVTVAIAAAIAASAAQADVSVCVNNKNGKARFATVCSKKETQQFLKTGGETPGDVRTISKKVVVPKGTLPARQASDPPYYKTPNFVADLSCADQEILLEYSMKRTGGQQEDNFCSIAEGANSLFESKGIQVFCGGGSYESYLHYDSIEPTTRDITFYLIASCIKK